ncbi:sce7726 family protein [Spirosoma oryzicola]|uniref:sce7726 family protein n=1 Tax=Spirosoma oryzicola TaxID=2898794 RepID=UPI001E309294|nr:sce7726 family protein [Spirosoma oryzicola]UHG92552.1 sce7726 family protein [Spirosoma oryzicola]
MRDRDIRFAMKEDLLCSHRQDLSCRIIDELDVCLGVSRIDIALINGSISGYEIKSERDTLVRLPSQLDSYAKVFDYLTLVASHRHLKKVEDLLPDWCGLIAVEPSPHQSVKFNLVRESRRNTKIEPYSIAQFLWKDEILQILNTIGYSKRVGSKPKPYLWKLLTEELDVDSLRYYVRESLKCRTGWRVDLPLIPSDD